MHRLANSSWTEGVAGAAGSADAAHGHDPALSTPTAMMAQIDAVVAGATAPKTFLSLAREHPRLPALHALQNDAHPRWKVWTLSDYAERVARAAAGLRQLGVGPVSGCC